MKSVEDLVAKAIEAIEEHLVNNGEVDRQYNGYISNFGASIIQSGLIPTIAFFSSEKSSSEKDRKKLLEAILFLIKDMDNSVDSSRLIDYAIREQNKNKLDLAEERILRSATAIKLAIRTFKLKDN